MYPPAACEESHSRKYRSSVLVLAASSAEVAGPAFNALYNPSFSPITTMPVWPAAPKSLTNCPTNACSLSMSSAGVGAVDILSSEKSARERRLRRCQQRHIDVPNFV